MKVLIVSYENWSEKNNGGNVLSNLFSNANNIEFAQIYCSEKFPENNICRRYLQISDEMIIKKQNIGRVLTGDFSKANTESKIIYSTNKKRFRSLKLLVRDYLWSKAGWKKSVQHFVDVFKPDLMFMPCYAIPHVLNICLFIRSLTSAPIFSYISDDGYGFNRFPTVPYVLYQLKVRRLMRNFLKLPILTYTMTQEQLTEYTEKFDIKMCVLRKDFYEVESKCPPLNIWKFIYAGGGYLGRDKVLLKIIKSIYPLTKENKQKVVFRIFSDSISKKILKKIRHYSFVDVKNSIPFEDLKKEYSNSNVAVHVESFSLFERKTTRLSFSTKIIDCVSSGCIPFAVGPSSNSGIIFLSNNNLGICSTNIKEVKKSLESLWDRKNIDGLKKNIDSYIRKNKNLNCNLILEDFNTAYRNGGHR